MIIPDEIKELIVHGASSMEIRKKALEEGKISKMRYDDYCMFYEELAQQKKW